MKLSKRIFTFFLFNHKCRFSLTQKILSYRKVILILVPLLQLNIGYSQWTQVNGPYENTTVLSIIPYDSLILISSNCGYFSKKSITDDVWKLNSALPFSSYAKIRDSLFVISKGLKLIDLSNPSNSPKEVNSIPLTVLASDDTRLYGGDNAAGFFKSSDFGKTWSTHNNGLIPDTGSSPLPPYYRLIYNVNSIDITMNYIFCGTSKGIYRSSKSLSKWTSVSSGLPASNVTLVKSFDDTLFAVIGNNLYKSVDLGNTWTIFYSSSSSITSILKVNTQYFIGTSNDGISYSTNNGMSWSAMNLNLTDLNITALIYYDSILLCGTKRKGVFYFQNGKWNKNVTGMICYAPYTMDASTHNIISNDADNVYKLDSTGNWFNISPLVNHDQFRSVVAKNDTVFLSVGYITPTWPYDSSYIVYSLDAGVNWHNLITPVPFIDDDPYNIYYHNGKLYVYGLKEMFYTDNLGLNWTDISITIPYFKDFIVFENTPFASANGQLVKLDSTKKWIPSNTGLPSEGILAFASCDSALFAFVDKHGMYVSFNDGINWSFANNGLFYNNSIYAYASIGNKLFVTTDAGVIFSTSDFGERWHKVDAGLKNLKFGPLKISHDTLYAGTANGIWKQSISDLRVNAPELPQTKGLLKIYPNPASKYVYVEPILYHTKFKVLNVIGEEVSSGILDSYNGIDISEISGGAYILFIQTTKQNYATKLMIIR